MADSDDRVAELNREVEANRREVDRELEQLRGHLTPGALVDEVLEHLGTNTDEVRAEARHAGRNMAAAMFEHPLPLLMIAGGFLWLALEMNAGGRPPRRHERAPQAARPPVAPAPPMSPATTPAAAARPQGPASVRPPQGPSAPSPAPASPPPSADAGKAGGRFP